MTSQRNGELGNISGTIPYVAGTGFVSYKQFHQSDISPLVLLLIWGGYWCCCYREYKTRELRKSVTELGRRERDHNAATKCRAKGNATEEVMKNKQRMEPRKKPSIARLAKE
ncbi:hypothetical protein BKA67DRAFT_644040 [Truncatella angustata]|uniref:Uncharacterized protein n=1 Tax=Truncatella angustata TaxID=152316 RepID=A0A9P9A1J5_9PEZI|nr:uncharacterized protein BKA67DRAFT_644040 [Truncatella angustata]KAH6658159.1 hypothetical protein BKA67DRAFT_644040 [Truncatella angustata]